MPLEGPKASAYVQAPALNSSVNIGGQGLLDVADTVDEHARGLYERATKVNGSPKQPSGLVCVLTDSAFCPATEDLSSQLGCALHTLPRPVPH